MDLYLRHNDQSRPSFHKFEVPQRQQGHFNLDCNALSVQQMSPEIRV